MAVGDPTLYKGYLGGHDWVTHTDEGSLQYAIEKYNIKSMLDIGCGPAGQVRVGLNLGLDVLGVDGDPRVVEENNDVSVKLCDFTKESYTERNFDLAWSCEFVEHVYEHHQENYMKTFQQCKYAIITFAPPGKAGNHHVNLRPDTYWIEVFSKYGFKFSEEDTKQLKERTTMKREFIRDNGLFFIS